MRRFTVRLSFTVLCVASVYLTFRNLDSASWTADMEMHAYHLETEELDLLYLLQDIWVSHEYAEFLQRSAKLHARGLTPIPRGPDEFEFGGLTLEVKDGVIVDVR